MIAIQGRAAPRNLVILLLAGASLAACATPHPRYASRIVGATANSPQAPPAVGGRYKVGDPYQVAGIWYVPKEQPNYDETGMASWYGEQFQLQPTANGETFDMNTFSAAHTTLPLPSIVEVTNLDNGRKLKVRVNDRGPFVGGRVIDLSKAAAQELGYDRQGLARVRVRYVGPAGLNGPDTGLRYASNSQPPPRAATPDLPAPRIPMPAYTPPIPQAPISVASAPLPPLTPAPVQTASIAPMRPTASLPTAPVAPIPELYRVQAGAFSDPGNAQRVAASLGQAGRPTIEAFQRDGETLYRVILPSGADEGQAWVLRDQVAALGFADARVLRPF